ncbi:hypothetical protein LEP1GSC106_1823 [Leptospira interrogans serovar Grippotyphosa str. UI 12764]|nr:hypothetical protein LEP1GSC106_1823 [Leptospira interrogans serovar Grippotyphosa str. UI 12764]
MDEFLQIRIFPEKKCGNYHKTTILQLNPKMWELPRFRKITFLKWKRNQF